VSVGALTHSAMAADLSFELELDTSAEPSSKDLFTGTAKGDDSAGAAVKADPSGGGQ
jgi:hypothetical protein